MSGCHPGMFVREEVVSGLQVGCSQQQHRAAGCVLKQETDGGWLLSKGLFYFSKEELWFCAHPDELQRFKPLNT